jgi:hypothetical protein
MSLAATGTQIIRQLSVQLHQSCDVIAFDYYDINVTSIWQAASLTYGDVLCAMSL